MGDTQPGTPKLESREYTTQQLLREKKKKNILGKVDLLPESGSKSWAEEDSIGPTLSSGARWITREFWPGNGQVTGCGI